MIEAYMPSAAPTPQPANNELLIAGLTSIAFLKHRSDDEAYEIGRALRRIAQLLDAATAGGSRPLIGAFAEMLIAELEGAASADRFGAHQVATVFERWLNYRISESALQGDVVAEARVGARTLAADVLAFGLCDDRRYAA